MTPTATATLQAPATPGAVAPVLVALAGPPGVEAGREWSLDVVPWVLGREPEADERGRPLALPDPQVSRAHVSLGLDPDHPEWVCLHDLGSKNGTFVDGRRAARAFLAGGEVVRVGGTLLLVTRERAHDDGTSPLVGPSAALAALRARVAEAAAGTLPVLVLGETGVGKEVVARAVHAQAGRRGPFRAVNCAAIARDLAESTLFGHRKGAFTGAADASPGLFRAAEGGTLLLDEVGELEPAVQAKLLRALEERAVLPVGSVEPVPVDVRVVAATNRDLFRAAEAGAFRADLLARLAGVVLRVPPLRDRRDDVLPLLATFLGTPLATLSERVEADALEALLLYDWPRNVRELEVLARRAATRPGPLTLADLDAEVRRALDAARSEPLLDASHQSRGAAPSRAELEAALRDGNGNLSEVARRFGRDRKQIYRWLERHGLPRS